VSDLSASLALLPGSPLPRRAGDGRASQTPAAREHGDPRDPARGTAARILDAAARHLAERGYGGLRIQDVARAADVRPAAIYYYFASRDALVEEVLWSGMSRLRRHVERVLDAAGHLSATDRLLTAVEEHLRQELAISDYTQASIRNAGQVPPRIRERQRQEFRAYRGLWVGLLEAAATEAGLGADRDRRLDLMLAIGALNWAVEWWDPARVDLDHLIAHARTLVRHGLLSDAEPPVPTPPVDVPPSLRAVETRDRILAATAATLRARGYAKTHLAEIGERAAVQAPAIYHYFPSRAALITTVLTQGQRTVGAHLAAALAALPFDASARDRTAALTAAHLRVGLELSDFATAVTRNAGQVPPRIREALVIETGRVYDVWRTVLEEAEADGDLRVGLDPVITRMLLMGALNWAPEWWHPEIDVDRLVGAALRLVDAAFRPPDATTPAPLAHRLDT
jgi:AcrR family transcriptional regulator